MHAVDVGIWQLVIQFVFRLTFGIALAMAVTPRRYVTSGFYRVHLWVLLGLNTFAGLAVSTQQAALAPWTTSPGLLLALTVVLSAASYVGSVLWLYERGSLGLLLLWGLAAVGFGAALAATSWAGVASWAGLALELLDVASSGLLLGVTVTAMLLGHWYLNTPTMQLLPLARLVLCIAAAIGVRALVAGTGLALAVHAAQRPEAAFWILVAFRWLAGLLGTFILALLTWLTLRVPNTQSATGILYAAVILTFLGELTSLLLSVDAPYPL